MMTLAPAHAVLLHKPSISIDSSCAKVYIQNNQQLDRAQRDRRLFVKEQ
jgi:hypothetical protein